MQRIIKNGQVIDETWQQLAKDVTLDVIPNCGDIIVPLALWREHAHALKARDGGLGVWLEAGDEVEEIADDLTHFQVIALEFPAFTDGRHSSSAYLLRTRYGYTGEVRAIGDVLRDQLFALRRVGFDAFALRADKDPYDALKAFTPIAFSRLQKYLLMGATATPSGVPVESTSLMGMLSFPLQYLSLSPGVRSAAPPSTLIAPPVQNAPPQEPACTIGMLLRV